MQQAMKRARKKEGEMEDEEEVSLSRNNSGYGF
jgi:hypothetical protein